MKQFFLKVKQRLQFTGWLQYLPPLVLAALLGPVSWACAVVPWVPGAWFFGSLSFLLVLITLIDLVMIKAGWAPREKFPEPPVYANEWELIRGRVSCRSFQKADLRSEHRAFVFETITQACRPEARLFPQAGPIRLEFVRAPLTVWPVVGAHEFLVAIGTKAYSRQNVMDVAFALENIVLELTRKGLATCWIGPGADQKSVLRNLEGRFSEDRDHVICVCALGYRSRFKPVFLRLIQRTQRRRLPLKALFFENYQNPRPVDVAGYGPWGPAFEVCQWSPSSFNGQPTRAFLSKAGDGLLRIDFCSATESRYYATVGAGIWAAHWARSCRQLGVTGAFHDSRPPDLTSDWVYNVSWTELRPQAQGPSYFDNKSTSWDLRPDRLDRAHRVAAAVRERAGGGTKGRVLDFGCGTGLLGMNFLDEAQQVVFADSSRGMLDAVEKKLGPQNSSRGVTLDLTKDRIVGPFHVVASLMVLHHIDDWKAQVVALSEALAPDGWLCLCDLDREDGSFHFPDVVPHNGFDREAVVRVMESCELTVETPTTVYTNKKVVAGIEREFPVFFIAGKRGPA